MENCYIIIFILFKFCQQKINIPPTGVTVQLAKSRCTQPRQRSPKLNMNFKSAKLCAELNIEQFIVPNHRKVVYFARFYRFVRGILNKKFKKFTHLNITYLSKFRLKNFHRTRRRRSKKRIYSN